MPLFNNHIGWEGCLCVTKINTEYKSSYKELSNVTLEGFITSMEVYSKNGGDSDEAVDFMPLSLILEGQMIHIKVC